MDALQFTTGMVPVNILLFLIGLLLLIKGADWFVEAAAYIAKTFNVSELVIGLTLVSIGTSLPELAADTYASYCGEGEVALGDIVGSNISNICFILGLGIVLMKEMRITRLVLGRDALVMIFAFVIFAALCVSGHRTLVLSRIEGVVLLLLFCGYTGYLFFQKDSGGEDDSDDEVSEFKSVLQAGAWLGLGVVLVSGGAKLMVDNVVKTAEDLSLDKSLVSATIVAFGTSVPELAVTLQSAFKGKNNIALGNIIGSCTFNLIFVMGFSAVINPIHVSVEMGFVLLPMMIIAGVFLILFMRTSWRLERFEGYALLTLYAMFLYYNFSQIRG